MRQIIASRLGASVWQRHNRLFNLAKKRKVAICGSTAVAIVTNKPYVPNDLDFAGAIDDVFELVSDINLFFIDHPSHWRIMVNANNDFVPSRAQGHIRLTSSFWLPVCIFLLPRHKFKSFTYHGALIQNIKHVEEAADELTRSDGKPRLANSLTALTFDTETMPMGQLQAQIPTVQPHQQANPPLTIGGVVFTSSPVTFGGNLQVHGTSVGSLLHMTGENTVGPSE